MRARIVAIADTFDVVSHGRRYRRGMSMERASEVIARGRDTQFDPDLVDLFLFPPVFERIREAKRSFCAPRIPHHQDRREATVEPEAPEVYFLQKITKQPMRDVIARLKDAGHDIAMEGAMAKLFSSQVAERVASISLELFGGYGYTKDYPAEKFYRDAKIGAIYEGTSNMQLNTIAKAMLK